MISQEDIERIRREFVEKVESTSFEKHKKEVLIDVTAPTQYTKNREIFDLLRNEGLDLTNKEFVYLYMHGPKYVSEVRFCPVCGSVNSFLRVSSGYTKTCGRKCVLHNPETIAKIKNTTLERYGTEHAMRSDMIKNKRDETCMKKYGVRNPLASKEIRKNIEETCIKKYGTSNPMCNKDVLEKRTRHNFAKYGVSNPMKVNTICDKMIESKIKNGTVNSSKPEDRCYEYLLDYFPEVIRQYKEKRYPYRCDFYIPVNDMFLECNFYWTHQYVEFDPSNEDHQKKLEYMKERGKTSKFFRNGTKIWSELDPQKKELAKKNNLNWKSFYSEDDFKTWLSSYHPNEYYGDLSFSYRDSVLHDEYKKIQNTEPSYSATPNTNKIILQFQQNKFYEQEKYAWSVSDQRIRLIRNRIKYTGKEYGKLSVSEILRGFKISKLGIRKDGRKYTPYSHFSQQWFRKFISDYGISSVYDPCGGWGHRLTACNIDFPYAYNDINKDVTENCKKISEFLGMSNKTFTSEDSSAYIPDAEYEAVFTCPPYWNIELFSDAGAENKTYPEFLLWWRNTVHCSTVKKPDVFAYIIREDFGQDMNRIVSEEGYKMIDDHVIGNAKIASHFRRKGHMDTREKLFVFTL